MILTLDEVEHGLPQIQLPLRMLLYFFFWPIFLFSAVIRVPFGRSALVRAPASRVLAVLRFVLPRKVFDRIFAQLVQDFRDEYIAELSAGRLWRARWMHVCFYLTLLLTILVWGGASVAKMAVKLWQMSG
ncbi:hypothetical protein EOA28_04755 [Mesorhizobium sp. M2A.F.Ca.ET.067.02.1.1]|nr:hypothetical protein EOA28_04755 [Mesorhizobium sp. M2A.F.Ca.ET.067.02.1.1]